VRALVPSPSRPRAALLASLVAIALLATTGCGRGDRDRPTGDRATPGTPSDGGSTRGDARDVPPDTSRVGSAFLALYRDGPLSELRIVRATDGRLVVAGAADFPAGTKVTVALLSRTAQGTFEPVASTRAIVDLGHFMSAPLGPATGPPPPGLQVFKVTAAFGPDDQDPAVLRAADDGRRYRGSGVHQQTGGRIVFDTTLEVPL